MQFADEPFATSVSGDRRGEKSSSPSRYYGGYRPKIRSILGNPHNTIVLVQLHLMILFRGLLLRFL